MTDQGVRHKGIPFEAITLLVMAARLIFGFSGDEVWSIGRYGMAKRSPIWKAKK
jgi:hypothetical protein